MTASLRIAAFDCPYGSACMWPPITASRVLQLRLIFACNSPEDLLMKKELDAFAAGFYGKFKVRVALTIHCVATRCGHDLNVPWVLGRQLTCRCLPLKVGHVLDRVCGIGASRCSAGKGPSAECGHC